MKAPVKVHVIDDYDPKRIEGVVGYAFDTPSKMTAEYIRTDVLLDEINRLTESCKMFEPDPLGSILQCIAAAEIEALKLIVYFIKENKTNF